MCVFDSYNCLYYIFVICKFAFYLCFVKNNQNNCTYLYSHIYLNILPIFIVETLSSCKNASFGQPCSVQLRCAWNTWTLPGPWTTWSNPKASVWRARKLPRTPSGLRWWRWSVMKKRLCSVWACSVSPYPSSTTWTPRVPSARKGTNFFFFSYLLSTVYLMVVKK